MRRAVEKGLTRLMQDLETLRERATVQQILAERDYERRYVAPRRAAKEMKERTAGKAYNAAAE